MMIIVCNEKLNDKVQGKFMAYSDFIKEAYSDEGLDTSDGLAIDVNILEEDVFNDLGGIDSGNYVVYFSLTGDFPSFMTGMDIQDWSEFSLSCDDGNSNNSDGNINNSNDKIKDSTNESDNFTPNINNADDDSDIDQDISNLLDESVFEQDNYSADGGEEPKEAKMYVFGSSKGGTGKTFTAIMSTYMYAKAHPDERIALVDFDIIDGQVGISIHKINPTMARFYTEYQKGYRDFKTMNRFCVKGNSCFPKNVDFYLAPSSGSAISDNNFWLTVLQNCMQNYDVVVLILESIILI